MRRLAFAAAVLLLSVGVLHAAPTVTDSLATTIVDNGLTRFTLDKGNGGLTSLRLGGTELLGGGGLVYYDANVGEVGTGSGGSYWRIGASNPASYSYSTGADFVDLAISHTATSAMPIDVTTHYVMRDGETGFHVYSVFEHTEAMADKALAQTRMVLRGDPSLFTHHSVTDTRFGVMPTPSELAAGTQVQDATIRLNPGTAYEAETGKAVYTKYDWSLDNQSKEAIGYYGDQFGVWIVQPHNETQTGGPPKQHLTVHQTNTTPVLLGMMTSTHYGTSKPIDFVGDRERTFGPFYVHLNSGGDHTALRADAKSYADRGVHQAFYDTLGIPDWTHSADRSSVTGQLSVANAADLAGATLVLSDNQTDFQFSSEGRQYWTQTDSQGAFNLAGVAPGAYRLTAYKPGIYGEMILDDVVVGAGSTLDLGGLTLASPNRGVDLWQIGEFDRTGEEFFHGANDEYRQYGLWLDYPSEFPNGVRFVVGRSDEATDWNYAHWESSPTNWEIEFDAERLPAGRDVTLTMAVAGHTRGRLNLYVNGALVTPEFVELPHSGSVLHRSGIRGAYSSVEVTFPSDLLTSGANTIALEHINPNLDPGNSEGIVYDALRLEIDLLDGDYNGDGAVDAADYVVWRNNLGTDNRLPGDPTPGSVTAADLQVWRDNYGATPTFDGPVTLLADADTNLEETDPNRVEGSLSRMQVRSRSVEGSGRQHVAYIRFDLSDQAAIDDALFELTTSNTTGWNEGQLRVYGLNDVVGNTPQDWAETGPEGLTFATSGDEVPGDGDPTTQDLGSIGVTGSENLWLLGDLPTLNPNPGDATVAFSSQALDDFLNSRAGGLATLIVVNADGSDRSLLFATRELGSAGPRLVLGASETATSVPEPTAWSAVLTLLAERYRPSRRNPIGPPSSAR